MSSPRTGQVVNVCFHGVGTPLRELDSGEEIYWVGTDPFLHLLDELTTWPAVRITFDDGNASDLEIALPALAERRLRADFFPLAGRLGEPGSLGEDGIRELRRHGMRVGTHGMWHRPWRRMDPDTRHEELVEARRRLAEVAQTSIDVAACPFGQYDRTALAALRRLGYTRVFTSDRRGARADAWLQPRYSVRRHDTRESLRTAALTRPPLLRRVRQNTAVVAKRWR